MKKGLRPLFHFASPRFLRERVLPEAGPLTALVALCLQ
jgi:hypothetical protein